MWYNAVIFENVDKDGVTYKWPQKRKNVIGWKHSADTDKRKLPLSDPNPVRISCVKGFKLSGISAIRVEPRELTSFSSLFFYEKEQEAFLFAQSKGEMKND